MAQGDLPRMAVSIREAAKMMGMSVSKVFTLIKENRFPEAVRIANHHPRWLISDLEEYLRNSKKPHQSK